MMPIRRVMRIFAALGLVCSSPGPSTAQPAGKATPALEGVRKVFGAAVAAADRKAIAKLSRFPLAVEVYGFGPKLSEHEFLRNDDYFRGWFFGGDAQLVKCLKTTAFAYQADKKEFGAGLWYLDCNGNEYYFGARGGKWAFAAYQNINE
jgi:hypothetical protein